MRGQDLRFCIPNTPEEELALAQRRVRERREGLKATAVVFGGSVLAGIALILAAKLGAGALDRLLRAAAILIVMPSALLAIVVASSLLWQSRLRRLTRGPDRHKPDRDERDRDDPERPFWRDLNDRHRLHPGNRGFFRGRGRVHARLRSSLRRTA